MSAQSEVEHTEREQQMRCACYYMLSNLLCAPPSAELLKNIASFRTPGPGQSSKFASALDELGAASETTDVAALDDEYHDLFIGLGRGELLPYASWYIKGMLMDKPLSLIREDLKALGMERSEATSEPEDHVAALCEIMGMLIDSPDEFQEKAQRTFFERHMKPWISRFFKDLQSARKADYYKKVGKFGNEFVKLETEYLAMPA